MTENLVHNKIKNNSITGEPILFDLGKEVFDPNILGDMWAFFRVSKSSISELPHLKGGYLRYLKNPRDNFYNVVKPLFENIVNSLEDLALYFISSDVNEESFAVQKIKEDYYYVNLTFKDRSIIFGEGIPEEIVGKHILYIFYAK